MISHLLLMLLKKKTLPSTRNYNSLDLAETKNPVFKTKDLNIDLKTTEII